MGLGLNPLIVDLLATLEIGTVVVIDLLLHNEHLTFEIPFNLTESIIASCKFVQSGSEYLVHLLKPLDTSFHIDGNFRLSRLPPIAGWRDR